MNEKTSIIKWNIDNTFIYGYSPSMNSITSLGSGSITVEGEKIREGSLLVFQGSSTAITPSMTKYFSAIANSTGLTVNYTIIEGTEFTLADITGVVLTSINSVFNLNDGNLLVGNDSNSAPTSIGNGSVTVLSTFGGQTGYTIPLGSLLLFTGQKVDGDVINFFVAEATSGGTTVTYRVLVGTEFTLGGSIVTSGLVVISNPRYITCLLEDIPVGQITKITDANNGIWLPVSEANLETLQYNRNRDGQVYYFMKDKNTLLVYRGMTSTNACFIQSPKIYYTVE